MSHGPIFIGTNWRDRPVPNHFRALARCLAERGHRVVLFYDGADRSLEDREANPGVCVWPSPRPTGWRDAAFLWNRIQAERPGVLVANFSAINLFTMLGWCARVPVRVVWLRTMTRAHDIEAGSSRRWMRVQRWRRRWILGAATHVVANSAATALDAQDVYGVPREKCRVAFNAIADPHDRDPRLCEVPRSPHKVVYTGRMIAIKGVDVLLRALADVRRSVPDLQVDLVGGRFEEYRRLAREIGVADCCTFTGALANTEVLRRMASAAVTVVPSRSEAFGMVNIESMAVGTPVVASAVGGIVEVVRDGVDGLLVPPEDPAALAAGLVELLTRPDLRRRMGRDARARFLAEFEQRRAVEQQADWLEELARGADDREPR